MNAKLTLMSSALLIFIVGCFGQETSTISSSGQGSHRVQLHDVSHIDFPGSIGRLAMSKDIVQLMIATVYDTKAEQPSCSFMEPSKSSKYAPWAPVTSFWRIHSNKKKSSFTSSINNLYPGFNLEKNHFYPEPKFLNAMEEAHKDYVSIKKQHEVPALKNLQTNENQIVFQLQTNPNSVIVNFLIETNYNAADGCQTNIEYWCEMSGEFCNGSSAEQRKNLGDYYTSPKNENSRGFGISIGYGIYGKNFSVVKSQMPEALTPKAEKFGIHATEFMINRSSGLTEQPATAEENTEAVDINPKSAEEILKEDGTKIVDLLRKAIPFSKMEITIDRNFIRQYRREIPDMFGLKTDIFHNITEDLIQRTGFESVTLKATSEDAEQNRLDVYFRFDKENKLAQRDVNSETTLNYLHFDRQVHVTGILTKDSYKTVKFEGVRFVTSQNEQYTVDKLLLLHSEEGNLIMMKEDKYVVPLDIKEVANFYHHNAEKIDEFQKSINLEDISQLEALKTVINMVMMTQHLPYNNHIIIQKNYGSNELDVVFQILSNALIDKTDISAGYDIVDKLTEIELSPGILKIGLHDVVESTVITKDIALKGRYALGKSIQSTKANKSLRFYNPQTRFYSTVKVNPNFNMHAVNYSSYSSQQDQFLLDGFYLVHDYGTPKKSYSTIHGLHYRILPRGDKNYGILNLPINTQTLKKDYFFINNDTMGLNFIIEE